MMDAKKALEEANGDIEAAIDALRAKGLATAQKKSSRTAAEGLVGVAVAGTKGVAVEVNSETDFVAKNDKFQDFVTHAWITVLVMDVWHWTPLVALLAYAGLRSIPDAYYQAARIDGASKVAVFRYIQLPKMSGVLMIAVLLRFMDSFMIYTEPFVLTGGGPGNATTFLSQYLTQKAVGQFDLGPAAAFSLIYFFIILLLCFVLYNWMQSLGNTRQEGQHD